MKSIALGIIAVAVAAGAAQAQSAAVTRGGRTLEHPYPAGGRNTLDPDLTSRFPEGSLPPGYQPTPLQETLARNGAATFDRSRRLLIKRNEK